MANLVSPSLIGLEICREYKIRNGYLSISYVKGLLKRERGRERGSAEINILAKKKVRISVAGI